MVVRKSSTKDIMIATYAISLIAISMAILYLTFNFDLSLSKPENQSVAKEQPYDKTIPLMEHMAESMRKWNR